MDRTTLNQKSWYRAIKVVFVLTFIITETITMFVVNSVVPKGIDLTYDEVIYLGGIPVGNTDNGVVKESTTVLALKFGGWPGGNKISSTDLENLKQNVLKMEKAGLRNQEINSYVDFSFEKADRGEHIQALPDNPNTIKTDKYNLLQKIGIYVLSFVIVLLLFWLISRIFFYVFAKEDFLKFPRK